MTAMHALLVRLGLAVSKPQIARGTQEEILEM
jgi:hypothetical protein